MTRRHVRMETPDGLHEEYQGSKGDLCTVTLAPGRRYVILPAHPNRKKNRGRKCFFEKPRRVRDDTGRGTFKYMAWVRFVDDNRFAFAHPVDLVPVEAAETPSGTVG